VVCHFAENADDAGSELELNLTPVVTGNPDCHFSAANSSTRLDPLACQYCIRLFSLTGETANLANILSAMLVVSFGDCIELPSKLSRTEETTVGVDRSGVTEASRDSYMMFRHMHLSRSSNRILVTNTEK